MSNTEEGEVDNVGAMESKGSILNLSDEILVHICLYLTTEDLVSLSSTCKRFNSVLCERKLVRFINLEAAYSLTLDSLKNFLQPRLRCQNVQVISFASCYWLNSSELFSAILRLTNLKSLHVNDTKLTISHLAHVLNKIKSIERISWTFLVTKKITANTVEMLSEELQSIKSFNLWVKGSAFFLPLLLSKCSSLEELKLSSYKFRSITQDYRITIIPKVINLPNIKTLILNVPTENNCGWSSFLIKLIHEVTKQNNPWNCLWLDTRGDLTRHISPAFRTFIQRNCSELYAVSLGFQNEEYETMLLMESLKYVKFGYLIEQNSIDCLLQESKITHILWRNELIPSSLPMGLIHLCMECHKKRSNPYLRTPISYKTLLHLTSLSIPACTFLSHPSAPTCSFQELPTFRMKQNRQSHLKNLVNVDCLLGKFTEYAPNVRELELKCDMSCNILTQNDLASLVLISNWSQLESLFIQNIPLNDISILITVCTACPKLRRFGLKNIGITTWMYQIQKLGHVINLLQNLEDFQFEQPIINNLMDIIDALAKLPKLRRVCIIGERTIFARNMYNYLNLLESCPTLVFLFVRLASISQKMKRDFHKELKAKFLNNRKSLWASIEGIENDDYWEDVPTIHCYEMISDPALLTIIPPMKGCNI